MTARHGFKLIRDENLTEYNIQAKLFVHELTGAELLSLSNQDENKVFGITFRTPPWDSTGVAHILEHSVLCGSRKFPIKEPFVELLKGSLQTFLNAFTYPDKTCYPVASQNLQDFYNLVDIYMDAALHPLLEKHTFDQEAWHYELNNPDDHLIYKGVVFNEMKGVYASADSLIGEHSQRVLFPDITYGLDYGGDPRHIPDLTWEQLVSFHKKYYHPSNSRIYFYGDDDVDERLRRMNEYLKEYSRQPADSAIPLQSSDTKLPARLTMPYPASANEAQANLYLTINWRLTENRSMEETLGLFLLDDILTETPASPLRKVLIDSELGEDLTGTGLETQIRQLFFSTGLMGIEPGNEDKVIHLIDDTLKKLARDGIDPKTIEAAINTAEFNFRELNTGNYPRGLSMMVATMQTWLYDGDPLLPLRYSQPLNAIKKRIADGEKYFESLINQWLLNNPNRTVLILQPDTELQDRLNREESTKLAAIKSAWTKEQIHAAVEHTQTLKKRQSTPDHPEALKCIPSLSLQDLERKNKFIPLHEEKLSDVPILFHDLQTQGITYLDLGFNLEVIPDELLSLVPLWARAILETGTSTEDFVELTQRIGRLTGGIVPELYTSTLCGTSKAVAWVFLRGKAVDEKLTDLLEILQDVMAGARLNNRERIRQLILEEKAALESNIIPSGHRFVAQRLRARFNLSDWIQEKMSGITYLDVLRQMEKDIDQNWTELCAQLMNIHSLLTSRDNMLINLTADGRTKAKAESAMIRFINLTEARPSVHVVRTKFSASSTHQPEGMIIPAQVNFIGKGINLHQQGLRVSGHTLVINRYLRTAWLWDQVRVQGGAYGGFSMIDYRSGQFSMVSYRDPNTQKTLDIYDRTTEYLLNLKADRDEIDRAVIGAIGDLDTYLLPDAKGFISMGRYLSGDADNRRQQLRNEVLSTKLEHFHTFGEELSVFAKAGQSVLMGSKESLSAIPNIQLKYVL